MEDSTSMGSKSHYAGAVQDISGPLPNSFVVQRLHGGQDQGMDLPSHTTRSGFETSILSSLQQDRANQLPSSRVGGGQLRALYGPHV